MRSAKMQGKIYVTPPPQLPDSTRRIIDNSGHTKRVYQLWKGSNTFFFGGRLIFGPDARHLVFTVLLIIVPIIFFATFISQKLVNDFGNEHWKLVGAIAIIFAVYILFLLLLTSGMDPGIIPRNEHPPEPENGSIFNASTDLAGSRCGFPTLPTTKDLLINGTIVKVKYCHTCMLYRPPRCSHCSICNNCVEHFDHHCPWVGQCIGKRNYRFFFMFVSSTAVLCLYVFIFCWVNLKKTMEVNGCNIRDAISKSPVAGILIVYTFVAWWFVGGLTAFHMYLICTNQTTYENFRYRYDKKVNPYNRGCVFNVKEAFLSRISSSKNDFRARVKVDLAASLSATSVCMGPVINPATAEPSIDLEMGGKRQAVAEEEFEDIQNQIGSMRALERCGTQPAHATWGQKGSWEITPDIHALAAELGIEHEFNGRGRIPDDQKMP